MSYFGEDHCTHSDYLSTCSRGLAAYFLFLFDTLVHAPGNELWDVFDYPKIMFFVHDLKFLVTIRWSI